MSEMNIKIHDVERVDLLGGYRIYFRYEDQEMLGFVMGTEQHVAVFDRNMKTVMQTLLPSGKTNRVKRLVVEPSRFSHLADQFKPLLQAASSKQDQIREHK